MGQKVNPHGLRVGVIKDWDSRWYASDEKVGDLIVEDYNIRKYLKKTLYAAGVAKIEIERSAEKIRINIHCSRPGVVIGKGGTEIEKLRQNLEKKLGREYRPAAGEAYLLPPRDEEGHAAGDPSGRQGHQGDLRRPSGRRGNCPQRDLP